MVARTTDTFSEGITSAAAASSVERTFLVTHKQFVAHTAAVVVVVDYHKQATVVDNVFVRNSGSEKT